MHIKLQMISRTGRICGKADAAVTPGTFRSTYLEQLSNALSGFHQSFDQFMHEVQYRKAPNSTFDKLKKKRN